MYGFSPFGNAEQQTAGHIVVRQDCDYWIDTCNELQLAAKRGGVLCRSLSKRGSLKMRNTLKKGSC